MRCFYCANLEEVDQIVSLDRSEEAHLFKTLRARVGEQVELINGNGTLAIAEIIENKNLKLVDIKFVEPAKVRVHLFFAPPKKQKLDTILKQCVELGISSINPFISTHSVAIPKGDITERWQKYLIEGCKQAKNPFVPQVADIMSFKQLIAKFATSNYQVIFGSLDNSASKQVTVGDETTDIAWLVGPEGGFSSAEIKVFKEQQFQELNLSRWVLRTETAITAGIAVINSAY